MTLVTRDRTTGLRRGPIRFPDGSPPLPFGCRWCGIPQETHGWTRIESAGMHEWVQPTKQQTLARMKARRRARAKARRLAAVEMAFCGAAGLFDRSDRKDTNR